MTPVFNSSERTPLEIARTEAGYTRDELAVLAGINPATVARIEKRHVKPQKATLFVLGVALDILPRELEEADQRALSRISVSGPMALVSPARTRT